MGCRSSSATLPAAPVITLFLCYLLMVFSQMFTSVLCAPAGFEQHVEKESRKPSDGQLSYDRVLRLYNQCSRRYVQMVQWDVQAHGDPNTPQRFSDLLFKSRSYGTFTIQSDKTKRYICFNKKGKLRISPSRNSRCIFREETRAGGKSQIVLDRNPDLKLGFKSNGRPLPGNRWRKRKLENCYNFQKRTKEALPGSSGHGQGPMGAGADLSQVLEQVRQSATDKRHRQRHDHHKVRVVDTHRTHRKQKSGDDT